MINTDYQIIVSIWFIINQPLYLSSIHTYLKVFNDLAKFIWWTGFIYLNQKGKPYLLTYSVDDRRDSSHSEGEAQS